MSAAHVAPKSLYYTIFLALMVGTAVTVAVAFVDLGAMNNVVMLAIAITKAHIGFIDAHSLLGMTIYALVRPLVLMQVNRGLSRLSECAWTACR